MESLKNFPYYAADGEIPTILNPLFKAGYGLSTIKTNLRSSRLQEIWKAVLWILLCIYLILCFITTIKIMSILEEKIFLKVILYRENLFHEK